MDQMGRAVVCAILAGRTCTTNFFAGRPKQIETARLDRQFGSAR
jgi:hypothetical protein